MAQGKGSQAEEKDDVSSVKRYSIRREPTPAARVKDTAADVDVDPAAAAGSFHIFSSFL